MKTSLAFLLLFSACLGVRATPFLVCDPYPAGLAPALAPVSFILKGLSANPISVQATTNPDGTVQLHYDLATLPNGSYTVIADAVSALGGVSPDSLPFSFTARRPGKPRKLAYSTVMLGRFVFKAWTISQ